MLKKLLWAIVSVTLLYILLVPESWIFQWGSILEIKPHHLEHKIMWVFTGTILGWSLLMFLILLYRTYKNLLYSK